MLYTFVGWVSFSVYEVSIVFEFAFGGELGTSYFLGSSLISFISATTLVSVLSTSDFGAYLALRNMSSMM